MDFDKVRSEFVSGIITLIGMMVGFVFGRRKANSEADNLDADAKKKSIEAEAQRLQIITDLQRSLAEMQKNLDDMRRKSDQDYDEREKERDAREAEREARRKRDAILDESVSSLHARNFALEDMLHKQQETQLEREVAHNNEVTDLRAQINAQSGKLEVIERKTGSLENKMPKH